MLSIWGHPHITSYWNPRFPPLPSAYPRPRHDKSYLWLSKYLVGMAFWMLIPQDIRRACGTVNLTQNFSLLRCGQPSSLAPKMFGFFGDASSLTTPSPLWLPPHPKWCVKCGRPLFVKFLFVPNIFRKFNGSMCNVSTVRTLLRDFKVQWVPFWEL